MSTPPAESTKHCRINGALTIGEVAEHVLAYHKPNGGMSARGGSVKEIGAGYGFLSFLGRVTLSWQPGNAAAALPRTVIVKVPDVRHTAAAQSDIGGADGGDDQYVRNVADNLMKHHRAEVAAYSVLHDAGSGPCPVNMPKCYGATDAYLILEDAGPDYVCVDYADGLDIGKTKAFAEQLAQLHAWSIKHKHWKVPAIMSMCLEDVFGGLQDQLGLTWENCKQWVKSDKMASYFGAHIVDNIDKVQIDVEEVLSSAQNLHKHMGMPDVFVHGDFHLNNVLVLADTEGKATNRIGYVIDWQVAQCNNPSTDLVRLFASSVNVDVMQRADEVCAHYYTTVRKCLGAEPPFTLQQYTELFHGTFALACKLMSPGLVNIAGALEAGKTIYVTRDKEQLLSATLERGRAMLLCLVDDALQRGGGENKS